MRRVYKMAFMAAQEEFRILVFEDSDRNACPECAVGGVKHGMLAVIYAFNVDDGIRYKVQIPRVGAAEIDTFAVSGCSDRHIALVNLVEMYRIDIVILVLVIKIDSVYWL